MRRLLATMISLLCLSLFISPTLANDSPYAGSRDRSVYEVSRDMTRFKRGYTYEVMEVEATAYTVNSSTGSNPSYAADGSVAVPYFTLAADPNVIPLGTKVYIPSLGWCEVHDTGGAVQGNIIDIAMPDDDTCYSWGRQTIDVLVEKG